MSITSRRLGRSGPTVSSLALGAMGMSGGMYGPADEAESIATVHAALEAGVTLIDTGDFYDIGRNELLLRKALAGRREKALLSVKFGALRGPDGSWIGVDNRPVAVKNALAYTLTRLGVDSIDIYRPGRLDPQVPIEDTVGAIADLVKAGYVRHIGLSEVGLETVKRAAAVHPICDVQLEYSLVSRGIEDKLLPGLRELGIGVTAYGVLSRGLLAGSQPKGPGDYRAWLPRFTGENVESNRAVVATLEGIARRKGVSATQVAIAWVSSRGGDIVPLVGARTRAQLNVALSASEVKLTAGECTELESAASGVAGTRYDAGQMKVLDSER
ncbi:MAG: aldo/keto reductase [Archangium sp.]|nr:aldo/keto reductase [Archangium sp.]